MSTERIGVLVYLLSWYLGSLHTLWLDVPWRNIPRCIAALGGCLSMRYWSRRDTGHGPGGPTLLVSRPASQQPQSHMRAVEMSSLHGCAEKVMGEETVGGVRLANQGSARKYCQKFYLIIRNFVADGLFAFSSHSCNEYASITACAPMSW